MAKFNGVNTIKTTNKSGHVAYDMKDKEKLVTMVLTTFFNEAKYYGDNSKDIIEIATRIASQEPKFISNLAAYARKVYHLRSVSHVLTCIVAHEEKTKQYIGRTLNAVVERADDLTEILACYMSMYGKPIPNGLKKAMAKKMNSFDEYSFAKYNRDSSSIKFKDILRLTHAKPKNKSQSELFKKVLDDNLATPITWETELSAKGNNKETWEGLIESNKVGYMAMLRNLRNILNAQPDNLSKVLEKLGDSHEIGKSKQLPFRFYSAYREIINNSHTGSKVLDTLENAIELSSNNLPELKGVTGVFIDASGSMGNHISSKSQIECYDIAKLLGVLTSRMCDDSMVFTFSSSWGWGQSNSTKKVNISNRDGILSQVSRNFDRCGGGTSMEDPFKYAIENRLKFDRIVVLSDNEVNSSTRTIQTYADDYRRKVNSNTWIHAIDLQGYGTQQFCGSKTNIIAGWSEKVLEFIDIVEKGMDGQVKAIENYEC